MNFLELIVALRKFGNFVLGLFPFLATVFDFLLEQIKKVVGHPSIQGRWEAFLETERGEALVALFRRHFWRDYADDRIDLEQLPEGTVSSLRVIFLLTILLCLLIPLAIEGKFPSVSIEEVSGRQGTAQIWSISLWLLATAFGWGATVAGATISNRPICVVLLILFFTTFGTNPAYLDRSLWNGLASVFGLASIYMLEKSMKGPGVRDLIHGIISALIIGALAGIYIIALTPLHAFNFGNVIATGAVVGSISGLVACYLARGSLLPIENDAPDTVSKADAKTEESASTNAEVDVNTKVGEIADAEVDENKIVSTDANANINANATIERKDEKTPESTKEEKPRTANISKRVWFLSSLNVVLLVSLVIRGGWSAFGGQLLSTNSIWFGYLWPVWYFIGVGIIFKLLKHTKVFAKAIKESLPRLSFIPVVLLIIVAGLFLTWSDAVVTSNASLDKQPVILKLKEPFYYIYRWSNSWLWRSPELSHTAALLRWVLSFEFIAFIWLAAKRKLSNESAASLFYTLVLSAYLIYEYNFEQFSFARSPTHSILLLLFFAISLLWLFHRVGLRMSLESTPLWPNKGRLPLYGGVLLFCLTEIHARCAMHFYGIMNNIFLIMFRGIVDVGLPYFLYIFATRRFKELPLKLSTIFGIFCTGALLTLPLNALDKLAVSNWSIPKFMDLWKAQNELILSNGITDLPIYNLPVSWMILKSALFAAALIFIARKITGLKIKRTPSAILFATLAFASGIASFSKTMVDLPLPNDIKVLIAPPKTELSLTANVLAIYLTYWLSTLAFAFSIAWKKHKTALSWGLAFSSAFSVYFIMNYLWPSQEAFLRSSRLLTDAGVILSLTLVYLIILAVRRIERSTDDIASKAESKETPAINIKEIHTIAVATFIVLALHANDLFKPAKLVSQKLTILGHSIDLPSRWGENLQKDPKNHHAYYEYKDSHGYISSIILSVRPTPEGGNEEILAQLEKESRQSPAIANLDIYHKESWSRYYPGSLACYCTFELVTPQMNIPRIGLTALMPRVDGKTEVLSLLSEAGEFDRFEWDIVRLVKSCAESKYSPEKRDIAKLTLEAKKK